MGTIGLKSSMLMVGFLFAMSAQAGAVPITLIAVVSDRGIDHFPRDGIFDGVFGDSSVTQITTPPEGSLTSEERTAIEFALGLIPGGSIIDSVTLQLSPQGSSLTLGLGANEAGEVHGYAGDGVIGVADLMVSNLVGSIAGPSPDGPQSAAILTSWLQSLVDSSSQFAGLMFTGVSGPNQVLFNFAGTFSGIPEAERPTLFVEYHSAEVPPIPEPGTLILLGTGLSALALRRRRPR